MRGTSRRIHFGAVVTEALEVFKARLGRTEDCKVGWVPTCHV